MTKRKLRKPETWWVVMKRYTLASLEVHGIALSSPPDEPQAFLPLFETKEQAVAFEDGDDTYVREMRTN